jgi:hypothetical protein
MLRLQGEMTAKQAELEMNHEKAQSDAELKQQEMAQKAALEKYRIDTEAQTKIQLAMMQSESAHSLENQKANTQSQKQDRMKVENLDKLDTVVDSVSQIADASATQAQTLADSLSAMIDTLAEAVKTLSRPRVPVRDKSGRIVRVD